MKKSFIRFFITVIICTVLAGGIFLWGWLPFWIPNGSYGVMLSKSSGYFNKPVEAGAFVWRWERLLPTNTSLFIFSPQSVTVSVESSEQLPSAEAFNTMLERRYDFSWNISFDISAHLASESLVKVAQKENLRSQASLDEYVKTTLQDAGVDAINSVITDYLLAKKSFLTKTDFGNAIKQNLSKNLQSYLLIDSFSMKKMKLPDMIAYEAAKKDYEVYQSKKKSFLAEVQAKEAVAAVAEKMQLERLEHWVEFLNRYPKLIEFLAVARDDSAQTLKILQEIRNSGVKASLINEKITLKPEVNKDTHGDKKINTSDGEKKPTEQKATVVDSVEKNTPLKNGTNTDSD